MIEKLKRPVKIGGITFREKINELCDVVNRLETMAKNTDTVLESLVEENNIHEKEIDKLQQIIEPIKTKIPTEYKWIGYLCKFKDRSDQDWQHYDILESVDYASTNGIFEDKIGNHWQVCEIVHLTDKEVYKVKPEDIESLSDEELGAVNDFLRGFEKGHENKLKDI